MINKNIVKFTEYGLLVYFLKKEFIYLHKIKNNYYLGRNSKGEKQKLEILKYNQYWFLNYLN